MQKIVWEYYGINFNRVLEKILSIVNRLMLWNNSTIIFTIFEVFTSITI